MITHRPIGTTIINLLNKCAGMQNKNASKYVLLFFWTYALNFLSKLESLEIRRVQAACCLCC